MARIDSILSIVVQQGATELRVGTDREPRMFTHGSPRKLSIPVTNQETLRALLGDLLSAEREQALRARGKLEIAYEAGPLGVFHVTLTTRGDGFDAAFVRGGRGGAGGGAGAPPTPGPSATAAATHAAHGSSVPPPGTAATLPSMPQVVAASPHAAHAPPPSTRVPPSARPVTPSVHLSRLVAIAASVRASDLHLLDGDVPTVRVDGVLRRLEDEAPTDVSALVALDGAARDRLAEGRSIDVGFDVEAIGRVRVNVYRTARGLAAALRLLPRSPPTIAQLHMPLPIEDLVDLPHGLVLVCGATGSGKSTTLAALAQEALRRRSIVLLTVEDPIEYELSPTSGSIVRQRQVGRDARDFADALRDGLREDPDVLLVGEMRDPETIAMALTAAETGHLVLTSLHSRSATSAIERIVDAMPPERQGQVRVQLADALRAVVAQRLVPRAHGAGRIPAVEVLRVTHAVSALIRESKTAQIPSALQSGRRDGMIALERCLADRVAAGEIRSEDARAVANDPTALQMYLAK